jgi:hypothetical protein
VAVKEFEFGSAMGPMPPSRAIEDFRSEISMLRRIAHPNVVTLLGAQVEPK